MQLIIILADVSIWFAIYSSAVFYSSAFSLFYILHGILHPRERLYLVVVSFEFLFIIDVLS